MVTLVNNNSFGGGVVYKPMSQKNVVRSRNATVVEIVLFFPFFFFGFLNFP